MIARFARACAALLPISCSTSGNTPHDATEIPDPTPFAVVEIFTSEGCNSCPVSDEYVNALVAHERASGRRVFPIAWHIDYWDDLGWHDPFDAPWCTTRQQGYADHNKTTIGTPEMFVNGASGSYDNADIERAVTRALLQKATASVTLSLESPPGDPSLVVHHHVASAPRASRLYVVLVERGLSARPNAGELSGKLLFHDNVARAFVAVAPEDGRVTLTLPVAVRRERCSLIAFVQEQQSLAIVGATQLDLVP